MAISLESTTVNKEKATLQSVSSKVVIFFIPKYLFYTTVNFTFPINVWDYDSLSCLARTYSLKDFTDILSKKPRRKDYREDQEAWMVSLQEGCILCLDSFSNICRRSVYHSLTERIYQFSLPVIPYGIA